ncbi:MAG: hypothetical protein HGA80_08360 [Candidatus Omnitrophica bacterium]|nr:hypothetical protein [Candidatus Omnitrophota bacterium]
MRIEQRQWIAGAGWTPSPLPVSSRDFQLVLIFGHPGVLRERSRMDEIRKAYPDACLTGCSTAGEIFSTRVQDGTISLTAVHFDHSSVQMASAPSGGVGDSFETGRQLGGKLSPDGLVHVFVLSDGLNVNGTELVRGLADALPGHVTITGGLAADGVAFRETLVLADGVPQKNIVSVTGFYGDRLKVGFGSLGGWDPFGPERVVTRSSGNVLYELDNHSALALYKQYLGEHAAGLPATGLLFPLSMRTEDGQQSVVRTILSVDEKEGSMTFAGTIPQGSLARLMKANFDRLIDGAIGAAEAGRQVLGAVSPDLAVLISCVGRKLILKQRIEEEVEGVRDVLGDKTPLTGFYSYGEISPFTMGAKCELHNQTMTITTFLED